MQSNKFDIELDRPSKVYYTGEVVTGTLTLKNSLETPHTHTYDMYYACTVWYMQL